MDKAKEVLTESIRSLEEAGNHRARATILVNLANLYERSGDEKSALAMCDRARKIFKALEDRYGEAYASGTAAEILWKLGDVEGARIRLEKAMRLAKESLHHILVGYYISVLGQVYAAQGDYELAIAQFEQGAEALRQIDNRQQMVWLLCRRCLVELEHGHDDDAKESLAKLWGFFRPEYLGVENGLQAALTELFDRLAMELPAELQVGIPRDD